MTKWKYLFMRPHDRFEYFLKQNPHRAFSAAELAAEFQVSKEEFTQNYPPRCLESAWETPDPQGTALPLAAPYGQNLETDPVRYHRLPSGLRLKIEREQEPLTQINKEEFSLAVPERGTLFHFRVPTDRMPLCAEHSSLCLARLGCYFYLQPDFSNLEEILTSVDQHLLMWEQEQQDKQKKDRALRAAGREVQNQKGCYHY